MAFSCCYAVVYCIRSISYEAKPTQKDDASECNFLLCSSFFDNNRDKSSKDASQL